MTRQVPVRGKSHDVGKTGTQHSDTQYPLTGTTEKKKKITHIHTAQKAISHYQGITTEAFNVSLIKENPTFLEVLFAF